MRMDGLEDARLIETCKEIPREAPHQCGPEGRPVQITMSPYYGKPDFSLLTGNRACRERVDAVSVADILRNAAVFPPHSIFEGLKMATFGFDPNDDMSTHYCSGITVTGNTVRYNSATGIVFNDGTQNLTHSGNLSYCNYTRLGAKNRTPFTLTGWTTKIERDILKRGTLTNVVIGSNNYQ